MNLCSAWSNCTDNLHDSGCSFTDIFIQVLKVYPWSLLNDNDFTQRRYHEAVDFLDDLCSSIYPGTSLEENDDNYVENIAFFEIQDGVCPPFGNLITSREAIPASRSFAMSCLYKHFIPFVCFEDFNFF